MTDFDLDHLGDVWRQQPDPRELEQLQRSADFARRRARWAQLVDVVSALAVAGVVLVLVLTNPRVDTLAVGSAAILVLLYGQYRQRRLRQAELRGLTGFAEEMLDQSIIRVEATRRRTRFSFYTLGPALLLGFVFSYVVDDPIGGVIPGIGAAPSSRTAMLCLGAALVIGGLIYLHRSIQRADRELERLRSLRDTYRKERELSAPE